jgi:hypothetical protein
MKIRPVGVAEGQIARQTDRKTEKHDSANSRFSYFANSLEIGEKDLEEVASHDAIFPKKSISKKKLPRIHIHTEGFHCSSAYNAKPILSTVFGYHILNCDNLTKTR